jgi:hypothetical protein
MIFSKKLPNFVRAVPVQFRYHNFINSVVKIRIRISNANPVQEASKLTNWPIEIVLNGYRYRIFFDLFPAVSLVLYKK